MTFLFIYLTLSLISGYLMYRDCLCFNYYRHKAFYMINPVVPKLQPYQIFVIVSCALLPLVLIIAILERAIECNFDDLSFKEFLFKDIKIGKTYFNKNGEPV